jgi:hypothetical protein
VKGLPQGPGPPQRSGGLLSDIRMFFLAHPAIPTRVRHETDLERGYYCERILQRLKVHAEGYSVLDIHRIGIEAPVTFVYEELLQWSGDSTCWPNHIARVQRVDGRLETIRILLLGRARPFGPLFRMTAIRIQGLPETFGGDNARYLLYECGGGYPIGIFSMYVRSPIPELGEREPSQLFLIVGFNFYGRRELARGGPVHRLWEWVHDRVTANVMNRFKRYAEWRFGRMRDGLES